MGFQYLLLASKDQKVQGQRGSGTKPIHYSAIIQGATTSLHTQATTTYQISAPFHPPPSHKPATVSAAYIAKERGFDSVGRLLIWVRSPHLHFPLQDIKEQGDRSFIHQYRGT
jgi:hypothetical protein